MLIKKNAIIAIIDLESSKDGQVNKKFLDKIKNNKEIIYISENGKEETLIITVKENYLSPISSSTLFKRGNLCDIY